MERQEILQNLQTIFRNQVFEDDSINLSELTTSNDIDGWDSFEQINILTLIEQEYHIQFDIGRARELKNVGQLIDYICEELR